MRVALVNPPWNRPGHYGVRSGSRWPHLRPQGDSYMPYPFYLGYTASLLEQAGFEIAILDGCASRESDTAYLARVKRFAPDIIVQENATASIAVDLRWAETFKRETGARLIMTGHHVGQLTKDGLQSYPDIDALAGGEWEYSVLDYCVRARDGRPVDGALGLVHRRADGSIVAEERRPNISLLDALPFPHRRTLDMAMYDDNPMDQPTPCVQLLGSRGCPYRCDFCVWPQVVYEDNKYRTRSAANMADEIEYLFRKDPFPYRAYYFDDDTFNIGDKRLSEFADELVRRSLDDIPWSAMCRADTLKKPTLEKLRDAGLAAVKYGVESGNQQIVQDIQKNLDLGKLREMTKFTHELGIRTHLTFSFGHIGETRESMRQTLDLALELDPYSVQFSIATPFPGTRFYEYALKNDLLKTLDYSAYDGMSRGVVRTEKLSAEELEEFAEHAHRVWERHRDSRRGLTRRVLGPPMRAGRRALQNLKQAGRQVAEAMTGDRQG
jgi:anaerobic magnesium-protoporphyrin IX monomethyl ester cyclase